MENCLDLDSEYIKRIAINNNNKKEGGYNLINDMTVYLVQNNRLSGKSISDYKESYKGIAKSRKIIEVNSISK